MGPDILGTSQGSLTPPDFERHSVRYAFLPPLFLRGIKYARRMTPNTSSFHVWLTEMLWRSAAHALLASMGFGCAIAQATEILFIGNSFTYAEGSPVSRWHADSVHDLNAQGTGGMPALFKAFTNQAGLKYNVSLETQGGVGLDWHLRNKGNVIGQRPWDVVVMHGFSTLDENKPGDPAKLIDSTKQLTALLASRNPRVEVRLLATWPRADQTYEAKGAWYGKSIEAMGQDVRAGYDQAAAATPIIKGVIPVGDAWLRAMASGVADSNPYDDIESGKLNLWAKDHYHASSHGTYLQALVVFGAVTGRDPRSLGTNECAAFELGLSTAHTATLQQVAFDELARQGAVKNSYRRVLQSVKPMNCLN
jgi:hypothetical protein